MKILYKVTCTAEEQADPHYKDACEAADSELRRYMPVLEFINGKIVAAFQSALDGDGGGIERPQMAEEQADARYIDARRWRRDSAPAPGLRLVKSYDD